MSTASTKGQRASAGVRLAPLIAFVVTPLLIAAAAVLTIGALRGLEAQRARVEQSFETRAQIQQVFSLLQDAETGQRGYVITGRPTFLEPYIDASAQLDDQLQRLDSQFANDPQQAERMHRLRLEVAAKLAAMSEGIEVRFREGAEPARVYVAGEAGKRAMDAIRITIAEMIESESRALALEIAAADRRAEQVRLAVAGLILALLAILLTTALLIWRHNRARQRLIAEIEEESTRQQAIFESTIDALVILNPSGSIESVNRAALAMFGYERDELIRRDSSLLVDFAPGEGLFLRRLALRSDPALGIPRQFTGRRKDGSTFPIEVALGAMRLADGAHIVAAVRDVTERKEAERLKDEFVSTVSHELRTPLTSIAGSLGLMQAGAVGALPPKADRLVHIAKTSCDRLVRLINDLLDMQKIASGKIRLENRLLDLRDVAQSAVESMAGFAGERSVDLRLELGAAPVRVRGDVDRLAQVLVNLISNGVKFSDSGSEVCVEVDVADARARVRVSDQGPGVPESFRESLFNRFSQADGSAARNVGGSGLGLAISREIVERHQGVLRLAETGPQGSVFEVALPLAAAPAATPGASKSVLVCSGEAETDALILKALSAAGLRGEAAGSLRRVEAALDKQTYAALLLGVRFEDGQALELIRRRAAEGAPTPPVWVLSRQAPESLGAIPIAGWIETPFEAEGLKAALAPVLGQGADLRILHVDDDEELTSVVSTALEGRGSVEVAHTLADARRSLARRRPDLIILDIGLPDGSGLELLPLLEQLQPETSPPVIVYSGQELEPELADRVAAVLTKSRVSFDELTRQVVALTRSA